MIADHASVLDFALELAAISLLSIGGVQAILRLRRGEDQVASRNRRELLRECRERRAIEVDGKDGVMLHNGFAPGIELCAIGGGKGLHDY